MRRRYFKFRGAFAGTAVALATATATLSGCSTTEVLNQGYVIDEQALALVPEGSSREQVLLSLGTPSTTATFDNEVFYYISQTRERPMMFMKPRITNQEVLAIYFNEDGVVERKAHYTLEDGRIIDMLSRTTPTGGKDESFLGQILSGGASAENTARSILGTN